MRLNYIGQGLILSFESFSPLPYFCSAGRLTIGLGSTFNPFTGDKIKPTDSISYAEAFSWFVEHVTAIESEMSKIELSIKNEFHWSALVSLAYNWGVANLAKSRLVKAINENNKPEVELNWLNINKVSKNGKKVVNRGLTYRRLAEWSVYNLEHVN